MQEKASYIKRLCVNKRKKNIHFDKSMSLSLFEMRYKILRRKKCILHVNSHVMSTGHGTVLKIISVKSQSINYYT